MSEAAALPRPGKFLGLYGEMFFEGKGVALYQAGIHGYFLAIAENLSGKELGRKTISQAQLDALSGEPSDRLRQLIEHLTDGKVRFNGSRG